MHKEIVPNAKESQLHSGKVTLFSWGYLEQTFDMYCSRVSVALHSISVIVKVLTDHWKMEWRNCWWLP